MSNTAPAGWYPQPDGDQRYWDGAAWTEQVRPADSTDDNLGAVAAYGDPHRVRAKNPTLMLLVSFFVPGLGTMFNGETGKGIGILVGWLIGLALTHLLIGLPFVIGFWMWGMVDAHVGAVKYNARHGVVST